MFASCKPLNSPQCEKILTLYSHSWKEIKYVADAKNGFSRALDNLLAQIKQSTSTTITKGAIKITSYCIKNQVYLNILIIAVLLFRLVNGN